MKCVPHSISIRYVIEFDVYNNQKNRASQANNRTKEIRESKQINAMLCSVQCNENKQTNQKRKKKLKKLLYVKQTTAQNKYDAIYKVSSPFHIKRLQCADGL